MAPEVIRSEAYDTSADVFSFGMLLYSVVCGMGYPYEEEYLTAVQAAQGVASRGFRPRIRSGVDKQVADVIRACWAQVAEERPRMDEVVGMLTEARVALKKKKNSTGLYGWLWG
eukprot:GFKZ01005507.1.p2 GENE.GFKZ01005507.1~~GFKZ01005507.1.p2  ORF type:complete len:114 (+),score=16.55 GFKZ01005507.1:163-504(+)